MGFREDAIDATEDILDALGDSVTYTPINGTPTTITAQVDVDGSFGFETEEGTFVSMSGQLAAKASDMPNAQEGDVIEVNIGTTASPDLRTYELVNPEKDGMGELFSWLTKL